MPWFLADVNLWLATVVAEHTHHARALEWWRAEVVSGERRVAFCRLTQLGLLRLLGNEAVMGAQVKTAREAWALYERFLDSDRVVFTSEPEGIDVFLRESISYNQRAGKFWTDAYLAAFAQAGALRLVTFDRDFERFAGLDCEILGSS